MAILPNVFSVSNFDTQTPILGSIPIPEKSRYFSDTRYSIPIVSNNPRNLFFNGRIKITLKYKFLLYENYM